MLKIGLTGGIGSGKSTACAYFHQLGVPIIDTDHIAHHLLEKGQPLLQTLCQHFGDGILNDAGELDRAAMRQRVFSDPQGLARLEELLHPRIREQVQQQLQQLNSPYAIIAIPLLVEKGWQREVDRVLVVDCDEQQQIIRATERDQAHPDGIRNIMVHQAKRQQRLAAADDILHNDGSQESLLAQVQRLHHTYLTLSQSS